MKVFITLELEGEEVLYEVMPKDTYQILMSTVDLLRKVGIPVQYKETNLPRRYEAGFVRASDILKEE